MEKARLTVDVDPELRRRIRLAAAVRDESLKEWIERALLRELEEEAAGDATPSESAEVRDYYPATGPRPGVREGRRPGPRSGRSVSEAVAEDRR